MDTLNNSITDSKCHRNNYGFSTPTIFIILFSCIIFFAIVFSLGRYYLVYSSADQVGKLSFSRSYIPQVLKDFPNIGQYYKHEIYDLNKSFSHGAKLVKEVEALELERNKYITNAIKIHEPSSNKQNNSDKSILDVTAPYLSYKPMVPIFKIALVIGRYLIAKGEIKTGISVLKGLTFMPTVIAIEFPNRNRLQPFMVYLTCLNSVSNSWIKVAQDLKPSYKIAYAICQILRTTEQCLPTLSSSVDLELQYFDGFTRATHSKGLSGCSATFSTMSKIAKEHQNILYKDSISHLEEPWWKGHPNLKGSDEKRNKYLEDTFGKISYKGDMPIPTGWKVWYHRLTNPYLSLVGEHLVITSPLLTPSYRAYNIVKQSIESACTVLAIEAYKTETGRPPSNLSYLNKWWNRKSKSNKLQLGLDVFTGKSLIYNYSKKILNSAGPDGIANTNDDILYLTSKEFHTKKKSK